MHGMAPEKGIVFLLFDFFSLQLLVSRSHVARRRFAFAPCFGALNGNYFAGHRLILVLSR